MTKWQESCITALASSPLAWEAFKMKQRNKQMLWQYINRIWPYKSITNLTNIDSHKCETTRLGLDSILTVLEIYSADVPENYYIYTSNNTNVIYLDILFPLMNRYLNQDTPQTVDGNNLLIIEILTNSEYSNRIVTTGRQNFIGTISDYSSVYENRNATIYKLKVCSCIRNKVEMTKQLMFELKWLIKELDKLSSSDKEIKIARKVYNSMNIGIEIEHDAENPTSPSIQKYILKHNCASYESGFDGNSSQRLRENRIRLNGIKGTKGLYCLLNDMKNNTALTNNSSVHIHVDCQYDLVAENYYKKYYNYYCNDCDAPNRMLYNYVRKSLQSQTKALRIVAHIFDYKRLASYNTWCDISLIRFHSEFSTIEYRFALVNLDYRYYILQILCLIHITECIKHNCKFNVNYLKTIATIVDKFKNSSH